MPTASTMNVQKIISLLRSIEVTQSCSIENDVFWALIINYTNESEEYSVNITKIVITILDFSKQFHSFHVIFVFRSLWVFDADWIDTLYYLFERYDFKSSILSVVCAVHFFYVLCINIIFSWYGSKHNKPFHGLTIKMYYFQLR